MTLTDGYRGQFPYWWLFIVDSTETGQYTELHRSRMFRRSWCMNVQILLPVALTRERVGMDKFWSFCTRKGFSRKGPTCSTLQNLLHPHGMKQPREALCIAVGYMRKHQGWADHQQHFGAGNDSRLNTELCCWSISSGFAPTKVKCWKIQVPRFQIPRKVLRRMTEIRNF